MIANTSNALFYLVRTIFELALALFLLRVLLQAVRADFYNPISQLVWRLTQPAVKPLNGLLPRIGRFDPAGALVLFLLAIADIEVVSSMLEQRVGWPAVPVYAVFKLVNLTISVYTLTLFAQAVLSWVGPGVSNPTANVLWSLNEPLLRPVRRVIPLISGLDVSPVVVMILLQTLGRLLPLPNVFA